MQQFLSPTLNNFSLGALPLNPLTISGRTGFGCTAVPQQFTVPNLVGCTFTWTTSANFRIENGQGTNRVQVSYIGTLATDVGWINLVINDSKGTFPNGRRFETRLPVSKVLSSSLAGYYTTNIDPTQTTLVDGSSKFIQVQRGQFVSVNFTITNTSNISSLRWSCENVIGSGNSFSPGWNAAQTGYTTITKIVYLDATTPCGIVRYSYTFNIMSMGWSYAIEPSPNPASETLRLSITKVEDAPNSTTTRAKSIVQNNNSKGKTRILLYNSNSTLLIKKWEYQEINSEKYNLNIAGIKSGVYVLKVERDNTTTSSTIIVK